MSLPPWTFFLTLLCMACATLALLYRWVVRRLFTEPEGAPPLAKVDGSAIKAMLWYARDAKGFLTWAKEQYGPIFTVFTGFCKTVVLLDKPSHERVLDAPEEVLCFSRTAQVFLHAILGWEVVGPRPADEPPHEQIDRIAGALNANLRPFFDHIVAPRIADWLQDLASRKEPVDWFREVDLVVMEMNLKCFLGVKRLPEGTVEDFVRLYDELETKGFTLASIKFPNLPFGAPARCAAIRRELRERIRYWVRRSRELVERMASPDASVTVDAEDVCIEASGFLKDFLTQPHQTADRRPWTEEEVVGTCVPHRFAYLSHQILRVLSTVFGARVNTLKTVFWMTLGIGLRPEIADRVRASLRDKEIVYDTLQDEYREKVIKEIARDLVPTTIAFRGVMKSLEWNGYIIPEGYYIGACSYFTARDPEHYVDPETFDPDRWSDKRLVDSMWRFFGKGLHRCRGEHYAYLLVRTIVAVLFRDYDLIWTEQKRPGELPSSHLDMTLPMPDGRVMVMVKKRE